jgi:hypothetical protein
MTPVDFSGQGDEPHLTPTANPLTIVEVDGRIFAPAQQVPIPEWPCTTSSGNSPPSPSRTTIYS